MPRIAVLSEVLINKIAAGEVVERPASVVKELCENAVDAGARTVRVDLSAGGLGRVSVSDDGQGMSREDAELCVLRHATSKLRELDDLFELDTKGFRGEAVPAIAAVSRFQLHTAERGAGVGTRVTVEGGGRAQVEDAPPREGTLVLVEDLFFNTPARRKFMKREDTELRHCEEAVVRLALAHPEVAFFLTHEGEAMLTSPACPGDPRERIAASIGPEVHKHLFPVEERRLGVAVAGWVASPEYTLPNARGLYTFVNRRYVRDRGLISAVQRAFQEYLPAGRQPVCVVHIDVEPRAVDVNVHPQKTEVRFADQRGVCDAVHAALLRALREAPWMAGAAAEGVVDPARQAVHYAAAVERFLTRAQDAATAQAGTVAAWGAPLPLPATHDAEGAPLTVPPPGAAPAFGQARPQLNQAPPPGYFAALRPLGRLGGRFVACEGPGGTLVVLDPHAALERVRHAALSAVLREGAGPAPGLFSTTVELTLPQARALVDGREALERLGVEVEPFGGTALALKAVPAGLEAVDARALLEALARALPPRSAPLDAVSLAEALRTLACLAAEAGARTELTDAQLRALLGQLDAAEFHAPLVHGSVVVLEVPLLELERRAAR